MVRRGPSNRSAVKWAVAIACGLCLALSGVASASDTGVSYGPSQPTPCYGALCKPPCVVGFATVCESRNPHVEIKFPAEDGCSYQGTVDWGDGNSQSVSFTGTKPDGPDYADITHTYKGTQVYEAKLPLKEMCTGDSQPIRFTNQYSFSIMSGHYTVVAIGDSYSSGEGAGHFSNQGPRDCDRSAQAWPLLLSHHSSKIASVQLLACSGATSDDLNGHPDPKHQFQPNQLSLLASHNPDLVTISIGGNDVDFAGTLSDCVTTNCITDGKIRLLDHNIHKELHQLVDDYISVARAAPNARVLVVGYPQLFPTEADLTDKDPLHFCGLFLNKPDPREPLNPLAKLKRYGQLLALATGDQLLNSTIASAAGIADLELDARGSQNRVEYVSVYHALSQHEFCTAFAFLNDLNPTAVFGNRGLAHPSVAGQSAIATQVGRYIDQSL